MKKELTANDQFIYGLIEETSRHNGWISMGEISEITGLSRRQVRKCITEIRECDDIDKIIIGNDKGYKLMSSEEEVKYLSTQKAKILKMLKRYWKDVARYNKNNQFAINVPEEELKVLRTLD